MNATTSEPVRAVDYKRLRVECTAFPEGGLIPERYTCDGKNISPPFIIHHIPEEAVCLALIKEDPDAPGGTWVHWLLWNMPVTSHIVAFGEYSGLYKRNEYGEEGPVAYEDE
ncbi:MAG TPA: YbhB/YbcL family Raf kinase inhibitor-like protein [Chitinophagaceae bacterium]|nr:YbhB/YbcL family Raf kinase inhibitor-like protein [Chitinophagaceae bacterium]HPH30392.1 YbhB/YbcL family Raf kinase inhibitor-like protein [Chitinophagaceae bacterium]HPN58266.1 YbhB/YbcL family Raf kinase inhibitor-like protein [Chitinophagaceae bacterium]